MDRSLVKRLLTVLGNDKEDDARAAEETSDGVIGMLTTEKQ